MFKIMSKEFLITLRLDKIDFLSVFMTVSWCDLFTKTIWNLQMWTVFYCQPDQNSSVNFVIVKEEVISFTTKIKMLNETDKVYMDSMVLKKISHERSTPFNNWTVIVIVYVQRLPNPIPRDHLEELSQLIEGALT